MLYNDEQFNQDIETALRMQSGFKGPIVPEAPGEPVPEYRNDPGYAQRQAALAAPGQRRRGVRVNMEEVLGLDRYIFEKEKANVGPERAMAGYEARYTRQHADFLQREKEEFARREAEANLGKIQAVSEKALGEAAEARGKVGVPTSQYDWATKRAAEKIAEKGEKRPATMKDIDEALGESAYTKALSGRQAAEDRPSVSDATRKAMGDLEVRATTLDKMRKDFDPIFTGQEAPLGKLAKFLRMPENPNFIRFRIQAQAVYAPARTALIGAAQTEAEKRGLSLLLPEDITKLSDQEAIQSMEVLREQTVATLASYKKAFKLSGPEGGRVRVQWGRDEAGNPIRVGQ